MIYYRKSTLSFYTTSYLHILYSSHIGPIKLLSANTLNNFFLHCVPSEKELEANILYTHNISNIFPSYVKHFDRLLYMHIVNIKVSTVLKYT